MGNWSERWSQPNFNKGSDSWTATRVLQVFDVSSPDEALHVLETFPSIRSQNPIKHNSVYPFSELLYCNSRTPRATGPRSYDVTASYSSTSMGRFPDPGNPLGEPAYWKWGAGVETAAVDRDAYGNPILNSAGDPFPLGACQKEIPFLILTVRRNEPVYNPLIWTRYGKRVNSVSYNVPGGWVFYPGQIYLYSYEPQSEQTFKSTYVPVLYTFYMKGPAPTTTAADAADGLWDSFKFRVLDQGFNGWYSNSGNKRGKIVYVAPAGGKGDVPANETLLNGTGKPIDSTYNVSPGPGIDDATPIANPSALPAKVEKERGPGGKAYFLKYTIQGSADFGDLNL